ncbi:MAG: hypothetical protein SV377_02400 [Halobacteria archaeon]|nr:hypothetical protein [Halobacteria archaeon]
MAKRPVPRSFELTTTDRWFIGWWTVNLLVFLHVVLFHPPLWVTYAYNGLLYAIGGVLSYYNGTVRSIFILATVAGIVELGADYYLVEFTGTLVYPQSLPMVLGSPLYMPLAWAIVTTHMGYLGVRLNEIYGPKAAVAVPSLVAVGLVGFYETGAYFAGIWQYVDAPFLMIGHVPLYIVVAEGVIFATLHRFVRLRRPILGGIGFGLVITVSFVGSYLLLAAIGT